MKTVRFLKDTQEELRDFPQEIRSCVGVNLYQAQLGETPGGASPLKGLGRGIFEIKCNHDSDTYRAVIAITFKTAIYVLHVFKKKSPKGKKMAQNDIDLIKQRAKEAQKIDSDTS